MEPDTNTQPIPPTTQQTSTQPPTPEKHKSPMLLWIFIFVLVGVASYFGYQNWQLKQQISQVQPTPTQIITPTTISDQTLNWKTYTYEKHGYSFKYPSEYSVEERAPGFLVIAAPGEHVAQAGISIESRLMGPYANYANAKSVITSTNTLSETKTVGNWEVFQGIGKEGMLKGVEFRFGITPYKTGAIEVETLANTQYIHIFDQILSTFEFIIKTTTTKTAPSVQISSNSSGNLYLSLPEESQIKNNSITIQNSTYILTTHIGPGLCNMGDPRDVCGYIDKTTPIWKTLRIWDKKGAIFAINPQNGTVNGKSVDGFILTKLSPNTIFSQEEVIMWEKISDSLFTGN